MATLPDSGRVRAREYPGNCRRWCIDRRIFGDRAIRLQRVAGTTRCERTGAELRHRARVLRPVLQPVGDGSGGNLSEGDAENTVYVSRRGLLEDAGGDG